jgi:hypothetical protein
MSTFLFAPRYEWVEYPDGDGWEPGWFGFKARIRVNPNGAELHHENKLFFASNGTDEQAQREYWQFVAPRVVEWNLATPGEDGEPVDVPPPAERWESLYEIPFSVMIWLRLCIHNAHKGPKALAALQGMTLPAEPTTTDTTPVTEIRRVS